MDMAQRVAEVVRLWNEAGGATPRLDLSGLGFVPDNGVPGFVASTLETPHGSAPFEIHGLGTLTDRDTGEAQWWEMVLMHRRNAGTTTENLGKHVPHLHPHTRADLFIVEGRGFMYHDHFWRPVGPGTVAEVAAGEPHGFYTSTTSLAMVSVQRFGHRIKPRDCGGPHCFDFRLHQSNFRYPSPAARTAMDMVCVRMARQASAVDTSGKGGR
jgi:mannose-6-phosphate isomerase-like protein (cupin superfamily)